jgi:hypothetical protein
MGSHYRCWLGEVGDGEAEVLGDGGDDEVVVVALGEAGEDDGAGEGGGGVAGEPEGEASAVGGEVGFREVVGGFQGGVVEGELAAGGVRAAVEAVDGVALAADPVGLVGLGAGGGAGEEELAVALDFYCAACGQGEEVCAEERAELPCGAGVEGGEAQESFLLGEDGEVLLEGGVVSGHVDCRDAWMLEGGKVTRGQMRTPNLKLLSSNHE